MAEAEAEAEEAEEEAAIIAAPALEFSPPMEDPARVIPISSFRLHPVAFPPAQAEEPVR
jgi:hypothetical protein